MIKAAIFDFDGVIVRTEDYRARLAWDERLGLAPGSVERIVHHSDLWIQVQLGRILPRAYWNGVAEMLYMKRENIPALRLDYFSGDRVNYRVLDLIRDLRAQQIPVALLCNDSIELRQRLVDLKLSELFDHILISAEIGVMKPDVTAYRVALRAVNVPAPEAVLIDDSLPFIRAAQTVGLRTIHYRAETDVRAELLPMLEAE